MKPTAGLIIADKVRLERQLARGGMGSVWEAHHERLDCRVAVKFMDARLAESDDARSRFEREAKAAARLRSPHVVQVFDYGVVDDTPYIVMELLEGEDLRSRLKRVRSMSLADTAAVVRQVCKALRLAEEAGIVHRDLKPANIYLARSSDDELVKVLDFGVAKMPRTTLGDGTTSGQLLGSPHYMSPEQARGNPLDIRSDLFSLAAISFEMLTGRRLFAGNDLGDIIVRICVEPLPKITELRSDLPAELDQYFERALARDRAQRYQSPQAMAAELGAIANRHLGLPTPISSSSGPISATAFDSGSFGPPIAGTRVRASGQSPPAALPRPTGDGSAAAGAPLQSPAQTGDPRQEAATWPASAGRSATPDGTATQPSDDTMRSQVVSAAEVAGSTSGTGSADGQLPARRGKGRKGLVAAALVLGLVGGAAVFVVLHSGRGAGPAAGDDGPAALPQEARSSAQSGRSAAPATTATMAEGPSGADGPAASAEVSASATAASEAASANAPSSEPPTPARSPKPTSPRPPSRPPPTATGTAQKHPVLGI